MSYDIGIGDTWLNYTWNMAPLFYDHMDGGIGGLHGLTGKQAACIIQGAFAKLNATYCQLGRASMCAKYDATNGWGSTPGALIFLGQILAACAANPRKRVSVS